MQDSGFSRQAMLGIKDAARLVARLVLMLLAVIAQYTWKGSTFLLSKLDTTEHRVKPVEIKTEIEKK